MSELLPKVDHFINQLNLAKHKGKRVLVAEDEPITRAVIKSLIEKVGLQVEEAEDGLLALDMVRSNAFNLILMDVQMPNMDGLAATQLIRQEPGYANVPIVAITASEMLVSKVRSCLDTGMNDFMVKPVARDAFYSVLIKWLSKGD